MISLYAENISPLASSVVGTFLYSGGIGMGNAYQHFTKSMGNFLGFDGVYPVDSFSSAIEISLNNIGIRDTKVLVSPIVSDNGIFTIIENLGAKPVFVDVDPNTGLLDPISAYESYSEDVSAVIVTDFAGAAMERKELSGLNVPLVVDAGHSFGIRNMFADYTCFNLSPNSVLTATGGGLIAASKYIPKNKLKELADIHKLNEISCALAYENMNIINTTLNFHKTIASYYNNVFKDENFYCVLNDYLDSNHFMYPILVEDSGYVQIEMLSRGIECGILAGTDDRGCPGVREFCDKALFLPIHAGMKEEEWVMVASSVIDICHQFL